MGTKGTEQKQDLAWATRVLRGDGLTTDSADAAINILLVLRDYGATEKIKQEADAALSNVPMSILAVA